MQGISAFAGVAFAERMYMARLELSGSPRLRVYQVDPTSIHVPEYAGHAKGRRSHSMAKTRSHVVPREERAWFGEASRKLCPPGFAAFGGSERLATEALLRVMRDYRDNNPGGSTVIGQAIRVVVTALEGERNASRAAV